MIYHELGFDVKVLIVPYQVSRVHSNIYLLNGGILPKDFFRQLYCQKIFGGIYIAQTYFGDQAPPKTCLAIFV